MHSRPALIRRAILLSILSIAFSGAVGLIAATVPLTTGSLALLGFGVDAVIDSIASVALVWRFLDEGRRPHRAERVERLAEGAVGVALLLLSAYLAVGAIR